MQKTDSSKERKDTASEKIKELEELISKTKYNKKFLYEKKMQKEKKELII